jgi:hypothetical protein
MSLFLRPLTAKVGSQTFCVLYSVLSINRPANRLTVLSIISRQRFRTIGCKGEKNLICISHLFRCVPPSIVSSKLKYLYTLISFVQANTYDTYLYHYIKQSINDDLLFICLWLFLNNPLRIHAGHAVALRYMSEGRGFDSRWCHWNFPLT